MKNIKKKLAAAPIKIRATFDLQCYTYEGIEAIKESLLEAKRQTYDEQFQLIFQMIAPPEYKVEVVTLDKNAATERIEKAMSIIEKEIKARGGIYKQKTLPTRIGSKGDGVEAEDILANLHENDSNSSGDAESNDSAMDVNLDDDGIQVEDDDEEEK